jgi:hypothetical protein
MVMEQDRTFNRRLLYALVIVGLGLRLFHYLRNPSMWHDEAALTLNVVGKDWSGLAGPLFFSEAAPPLFLWAEKAVVALGGESTYALRLVPLLASCAAFLAGVFVARRLLPPTAVPWAALLLGCSDRLLWHACEAKPYAVDVLVAAGLLAIFVRFSAWPAGRQLLLYAALTPGLIFLSYPSCFLLGGLALALLPAAVRERGRGSRLAFGLFLAVLAGSSLLLLAGPVRAQRNATLLECWQDVFPDWGRPWSVPGWLALRSVEVFRYACEPVGGVLTAAAAVGAVAWWRAGRRRLVAFLVLPLALTGAAGLLGQYPFGATRVMAFAVPVTTLLIAAGLPPTFAWLRRRGRLGPALLAGIVLFPAAQAAYRVWDPWPRSDSARAAAWVRAQLGPGDRVVGTSWEHSYYLRDLGGNYRLLDMQPPGPVALASAFGRDTPEPGGPWPPQETAGSRVWVLVGGKTPDEHQAILEKLTLPGAWGVREQHPFARASVFRLECRGLSAGPGPLAGRSGPPRNRP